jgi:hypothetical protein
MTHTKIDLVKDIFFEATRGMRTADNFVEGQYLMDEIARNNYKSTIKAAWDDLDEDRKPAHKILGELVDITARNTYNANLQPTPRTREIEYIYYTKFAKGSN